MTSRGSRVSLDVQAGAPVLTDSSLPPPPRPQEEVTSRSSRVSLDVQAGAPVLLLPLSAGSRQLLVADLGRLRVTNTFRLSGAEPPDAAAARDIPFSRR